MSLIFAPDQKIKYSGSPSFSFSLEVQKEESLVVSLIASASRLGMPIPTKCTWKRCINNRVYPILLNTK